MKSNRYGVCRLCGENKKLSFEHVPPKSSFNNKSIFVVKGDSVFDKENINKNKIPSHRGFGEFTLCIECNNKTGSWYGESYKIFSHVGMFFFKEKGLENATLSIGIKCYPMNFIKQVLTMFLSADKSDVLRNKYGIDEFLLNKNDSNYPHPLKVYMYACWPKFKRMFGYSLVADNETDVYRWSEISFQPFGFFLTDDCSPPDLRLVDITHFSNFKYNDLIPMQLEFPFLENNTPLIGDYRTEDEIRNGIPYG